MALGAASGRHCPGSKKLRERPSFNKRWCVRVVGGKGKGWGERVRRDLGNHDSGAYHVAKAHLPVGVFRWGLPLHAIRAQASVFVSRAQCIHERSCVSSDGVTRCRESGLPIRRTCALVLIYHPTAVAAKLAITRVNTSATAWGDDFDKKTHCAFINDLWALSQFNLLNILKNETPPRVVRFGASENSLIQRPSPSARNDQNRRLAQQSQFEHYNANTSGLCLDAGLQCDRRRLSISKCWPHLARKNW